MVFIQFSNSWIRLRHPTRSASEQNGPASARLECTIWRLLGVNQGNLPEKSRNAFSLNRYRLLESGRVRMGKRFKPLCKKSFFRWATDGRAVANVT